jgi:hypothetical protein
VLETRPIQGKESAMNRTTFRATFAAVLASAALAALAETAQAEQVAVRPENDLFYNYYANSYVGVPARLYVSPRPTPPFVGHTYYTYQPLLPHEFLYRPHSRVYTRLGPGGLPVNRTTVHWW